MLKTSVLAHKIPQNKICTSNFVFYKKMSDRKNTSGRLKFEKEE